MRRGLPLGEGEPGAQHSAAWRREAQSSGRGAKRPLQQTRDRVSRRPERRGRGTGHQGGRAPALGVLDDREEKCGDPGTARIL